MPSSKTEGAPIHLAAIDIGTNSFHLIVAAVDPEDGHFTVLDREKEIVRLGSGSTDMKRLSDEAMRRGVQTLRRFKAIAEASRAQIRAVATSAVREALNRQEFIDLVRSETGIDVEVISGVEEARLIYLGVLQAIPSYSERTLLVDIGGGSTEFLVGRRGRVQYANSLKVGAIRLTQRFFPGGEFTLRDVKKCREFLAGMLNPVARSVRALSPSTAVGSSGTILNLANMIRIRRGEDPLGRINNFAFRRRELEDIVDLILSYDSPARRKAIPGLDPSRADIIVAGSLILQSVMAELKVKEMRVSEYALREGMILDTVEQRLGAKTRTSLEDVRRQSVLQVAKRFRYEKTHSHQVARIALRLFDQLKDLHQLGPQEREYLEAAALLHEIGLFVSHAQHHRHSYYLIRNAEILGFTDPELEMIANIARYHRKSQPKPRHDTFARLSPHQQGVVRALASLLRIADGLDRTHSSAVRDVRVRRSDGSVTFQLRRTGRSSLELEIWGAMRKRDLFESTYGVAATFQHSG